MLDCRNMNDVFTEYFTLPSSVTQHLSPKGHDFQPTIVPMSGSKEASQSISGVSKDLDAVVSGIDENNPVSSDDCIIKIGSHDLTAVEINHAAVGREILRCFRMGLFNNKRVTI
jgi:hypothetical protein